jgi:hypothetical protein
MAKASRPRAAAQRRKASAPRLVGPPQRPTRPAKIYTSKPVPIDFAGPSHRYDSADLEIMGIYHGEASYEGRIFLNNPKADASTPCTLDHGYAGSFHIFGHGGCFGDAGHCEVPSERDPYDWRPPHPLTPANKRVEITDALRETAKKAQEMTITVVPVVSAANDVSETHDVFHCENMRLVTYNP